MVDKSDKEQDKELTPEFEGAIKKLLATPPKPRKLKRKPTKKLEK